MVASFIPSILDELDDVIITSPQVKHVLRHDGTDWKNAQLAHSDLTGLSNDDHSIYALLAGRSGGQTFIGGDGASNNLTLQSTSHATRGNIVINDDLETDRWLGSDTNTFVGINIAGAGNLAHTTGVEGWYNTMLGNGAFYSNTTGNSNVAVGGNALYFNTTGAQNVGLGPSVLYSNSTGSFNTAIGANALYSNTGSNNTAVGRSALFNATGSNNTAIGYGAGDNITTGTRNIIIGYNIDAPSATADYQLNIGDTIYGQLSNKNIGLNTSTWGTSASGVFAILNGTAPTSSPADMIQIFSTDISGGDATLGLRTEAVVAADTDETKFSDKLPVKINGTTYYVMLTQT